MTPKINVNDALWLKYENFLLNEQLSHNRMQKLKMVYNVIRRGFKDKPLEDRTRKDVEDFINELNHNTFKREDGKIYQGNTKLDIKKFLKQFWKWLKGNNEDYPPEVRWIKARIGKDEKPIEKEVMSVAQASKLANSFSKSEYRALVLLLFDTGFRISEMLSVTKKDLTYEDYEDGQACFWVKCNQSKTYVRKIPAPLFTEDIQAFVNGSYYKSLEDNAPLFNMSYASILQGLNDHAKEIIHRKITPHLFRHSSATYYARELGGNTLQLATRYGWSLGSDELKTYVRLSGAFEKQAAKQVYGNETIKLRKEVEEMKTELAEYKKAIAKLVRAEKNR